MYTLSMIASLYPSTSLFKFASPNTILLSLYLSFSLRVPFSLFLSPSVVLNVLLHFDEIRSKHLLNYVYQIRKKIIYFTNFIFGKNGNLCETALNNNVLRSYCIIFLIIQTPLLSYTGFLFSVFLCLFFESSE